MNNADWKEVEKRLGLQFHPVELMCDGYRLYLELQRVSNLRLAITFHINGWFRGKWMIEDCEERRRFFPVSFRSIYGQKRKNWYKSWPKWMLRDLKIDLNEKHAVYGVSWSSFTSLKRHLIKNNNSIEMFREGLQCNAKNEPALVAGQ
jgi:hypothetical protein